MASDTITIPKLISAMKAAGFTTQADLDKQREEIKNDTWDLLAQFEQDHIKPEFDVVNSNLKQINKNQTSQIKRLGKLEAEQQFIHDDIRNLTAEYSDTPPRKEFNQLKAHIASAKN